MPGPGGFSEPGDTIEPSLTPGADLVPESACRRRRPVTGGCPLAGTVLEADLAAGAVFPALERIRDVSHAVACAVIRRAALEGHAEPAILDDLEDTVRRSMWHPDYLPVRYEPEDGTAGDSRRWAER